MWLAPSRPVELVTGALDYMLDVIPSSFTGASGFTRLYFWTPLKAVIPIRYCDGVTTLSEKPATQMPSSRSAA